MEQVLARLANAGLEGEAENVVLQTTETNQTFNLSQIKYVSELGETYEVTLNDNDLNQELIQRILNIGHQVNITFDENNIVTLYF